MQKTIKINGLCRSGNHAIIFWILNNISEVADAGYECYVSKNNKKICFLNNVSRIMNNINSNEYEIVLKSYEDVYIKDCFYIIRDFLNLISSRYKKFGNQLGTNKNYLTNIEDIIKIWKKMILSDNKIIYNKWIYDKNYRDEIGQMIQVENCNDKTDYVSKIGQGSSFIGIKKDSSENYESRYEKIKLPDFIIKKILNDKELIELNKNYFKIDMEEKLNF